MVKKRKSKKQHFHERYKRSKFNIRHDYYFRKMVKELKEQFPHFIVAGNYRRYVIRGTLKPTTESPTYSVYIVYKSRRAGTFKENIVYIDYPALAPNPPHMYQHDNSLCLYHPLSHFSRIHDSVSKHIIPWTACWLYFYEAWLKTSVFWAAEAPHTRNKTVEDNLSCI